MASHRDSGTPLPSNQTVEINLQVGVNTVMLVGQSCELGPNVIYSLGFHLPLFTLICNRSRSNDDDLSMCTSWDGRQCCFFFAVATGLPFL